MLGRRIIPCLDVTDGRVVKGVNFVNLVDAGDPVEIATRYNEQGADELCFLDITATSSGRDTLLHVVEKTASCVFIPLTVGGGIRTVEDMRRLLDAGADKGSVNSAAFQTPGLISDGAAMYGSQFVVCAVDARSLDYAAPVPDAAHVAATYPEVPASVLVDQDSRWQCYVKGGREPTGIDAVRWAQYVAELGAGEILLTSMDADGTKQGFDVPLTRAVSDAVGVPVIASGGVGSPAHFVEGFEDAGADACLAASIFHFGEFSIAEVKEHCARAGVLVRTDWSAK